MSATVHARHSDASASDHQFATFVVDSLLFGVEVLRVQEVLRYQEMTPVPRAAEVVEGLINLRGQIVTAIDVRRRLGLKPRESERTPMNMVVRSDDGAVSLLVDEIGDVLDVDDSAFEPVPENVSAGIRELTTGVYKLKDRLLLILDTAKAIDVNTNGGRQRTHYGDDVAFTFFFRDQHVLDLVVKHAVPQLAGRSRARVWDAGCAMGPEPYSLAILLAESMGYFAFNNLRIDASDLDDCGLFGPIIAAGEYPWQELERVPPALFAKDFEPAGENRFRVVDRVRSRLAFHRHDLLSLKPVGDGYNLIVCKNVLLHFQPAERVDVFKMFHRALAPDGLLATEQTQKLPPEIAPLFSQVVSDGQVFQKADVARATAA